jgi:hypothetical protein
MRVTLIGVVDNEGDKTLAGRFSRPSGAPWKLKCHQGLWVAGSEQLCLMVEAFTQSHN